MTDIEIRLANEEDYPVIEKIMQQVQQLHISLRPDIYKPVSTALTKEELMQGIGQKSFYVAEAEGKPVGVLSFLHRSVRGAHQVPREVLFVDTMAVDEAYRGKGVGKAFLEFLKEEKTERGFDGIELQVNARNIAAYDIYRHWGFTEKSINMELPE